MWLNDGGVTHCLDGFGGGELAAGVDDVAGHLGLLCLAAGDRLVHYLNYRTVMG